MDHVRERKTPDPSFGRQMQELNVYHRAYSDAFSSRENVGVLVRLLALTLNQPEEERDDVSAMVIELVLTLLVNLLHTEPPDAPPPKAALVHTRHDNMSVLRKTLVSIDSEDGLELLVYILQQACLLRLPILPDPHSPHAECRALLARTALACRLPPAASHLACQSDCPPEESRALLSTNRLCSSCGRLRSQTRTVPGI